MSGSKNDSLGPKIEKMISGLKTALPPKTRSITVESVVRSVPTMIRFFEAKLRLWTAAEEQRLLFHGSVQERDDAAPEVRALLADLKPALMTHLGSRNKKLLKFGIKPKGPRKQLTGEERALANAKMRATRKQRGTMGRRQKAAIERDVSSGTIGGNGHTPADGARPSS